MIKFFLLAQISLIYHLHPFYARKKSFFLLFINTLRSGRRYGNYGNYGICGICGICGVLGAAMQKGPLAQGQRGMFAVLRHQPLGNTANRLWLGRRGKGACLQCCVTSRWGVQQTGSGWGGAMGIMGTMGTVGTMSTGGSWAPRCKQACWGAENKQAFLHRTPANRLKIPLGNALTKQACWAQKTNRPFCIVPRPIG